MPADLIDTVVIGAGPAGLGVSRELTLRGIEHLVLEQGRVGETWRSQRWGSFALNTPAWMNRLPGDPAPAAPDDFQSAPQLVRALERYVRRNRLPAWEGVTVRSLRSNGDRLAVATSHGLLEARAVVIASGGARVPRVPAAAAALQTSIRQVHTAEYRTAAALPPGAVLVVGGAQSGVQVAEDLLRAGSDVFLATSAVGRLPRRYRGRDTFAWLVDDGFFDEPRPDGQLPANAQVAGGRTLSYQHLERLGAVLLGGVEGVSGSRIRLRDDLARNIVFSDAASAGVRVRIDAHIARAGLDAPPPERDPADACYPIRSLPRSPSELDLRRAGVRTVLWATGFDPDTDYVHDGARAAPGLFLTGQPWLPTRGSGTIRGIAADAPHVAARVDAHLAARRRIAA